jgi:glycosyltransferase involved in cell wall biosynthesis
MRKAMLSVLMETRNDEERLAVTLASLVGGAVEGMVREVVVCDAGSTDRTRDVAEHAGCRIMAGGGIAMGIAQARSDWLLFLEPGARLEEGWIEAVATHIGKAAMAARFSRAKASRAPFLSRMLSRTRALEQGLLVTRRQAAVLSKKAASAEALARGLAVKTLRTGIWPAPAKRA